MNLSKLYLIATILALLTSCNNGKESKASAFLLENNRHYAYTETALVGAGGNRIPFSPYQYSTLYGALDTLETLKVFNTVYTVSRQYGGVRGFHSGTCVPTGKAMGGIAPLSAPDLGGVP